MSNQNPNAVNNGGSVFATVALSSISVRAVSGARAVAKLSVGDLNGDGVADLALGVSASSPLVAEHGVIFGQANSLTTQLNGGNFTTTTSPSIFKFASHTGVVSFSFSDIDHDGDSDLLHFQDFGWSPSGTVNAPIKIAVMEGDATPDSTTDQTLLPNQGYYGVSLVTADFNGDGYADLFSGSIVSDFNSGPAVTATTASLAGYLGGSGGLATAPSLSGYTGITPTHGGSRQAHTLALGAVDLNGDGYDDIVTNVTNQAQGVIGNAKITFGNSAGTFEQNLSSNTGGLLLQNFSFAGGNQTYRNIASGGDVNGDGLADMAGWSGGHRDILDPGTGSFVLFGNTSYASGGSVDISALNGTNGIKLTGVSSGINSMALGDLNGDGIGDIVVGSKNTGSGAGKLWVVWGKDGSFSSGSIDLSVDNPALFTNLTGAASQGIGTALTIADMDGDGRNDLVVGAEDGTVDIVSGEHFQDMLITPLKCYSTFEDRPLTLSTAMLLSNDSDPDSDPLTIQSVQGAVGGTVDFDLDGNIVFTPTANYNGPASFTYTISDGNGGADTATVNLTVKSDEMALASVGVRAASNARGVAKLSAGDFNGDGATDLALGVSASSPLVSEHGVILGQASSLATQLNGGNFTTTTSPSVIKFASHTGVVNFEFADIDLDGDRDLLRFEDFGWSPSGTVNAPIKIAVMEGDATPDNATDQMLLPSRGYYGAGIVTGDFNGDGHLDVFTGSIVSDFNGGGAVSTTTPIVAGFLGSSGGLSTSPTISAYAGLTPVGVASKSMHGIVAGALDINGDGYDDIVTTMGGGNDGQTNYGPTKITFGNSAGTFEQNLSSNTGGLLLQNFTFSGGDNIYRNITSGGDVNGDGVADMAGWSGGHLDILNPGTGSFVLFGNTSYAAGSSVDIATLNGSNGVKLTGVTSGINSMALGDLNGDGLADIVVGSKGADSGAGKLWVVWGKDGGFSSGSIDLSAE
ncbi:MAG: FG-GAP-like repeat-containing protein, partial [Ferrovibrio sp.]|uniref:FG-GAP-like repeat-containing protein n=1 Tax=Ferrovibrio sp. TaxID=1917215 RepID=UPI00261BC500